MRDVTATVPALERGLDVLEALNSAPGGMGISDLATRLGLNKNAVFRITHTLMDRGYLERDPATKQFRLSSKTLSLGQPRQGDVSLVEVSLGPMRALRDHTRETVQLGLPAGDEGVIIEQASGLHPLRIAVDIGLRFPLHNNAPGKLILAWLSAASRTALLERLPLPQSTSRTLTTPADLERECLRIREQGYSTDFAEADEGIHCLAAPIAPVAHQLLACVWVSAPARRLPRSQFASVARHVQECAAAITEAFA